MFFLFYAGIFVSRLLYKWYPAAFVSLEPLLYACHTCIGPVLYYIVFKVTPGKEKKRFSRIHIVLPLIMPVIVAVWMFFVPFEVPLGIVQGFWEPNPDYPLFSRAFASIIASEICFDAVYLSLSFIRLHRFRKTLAGRKKNDSRYQMRWLTYMLLIVCGTLIHPAIVAFTSMQAVYEAHWLIFPSAVVIFTMQILLLYNLQRHNYPPLDIKTHPEANKLPMQTPRPVGKNKTLIYPLGKIKMAQLSRKDFDQYFRHEKPYLDPQLKLTSLAEVLGVNRIDLSKFVNSTYKVNFNVFVNRWRFEEVERLRKLNKNKGVTLKSLILQAGFASYNSFMRARQQAEGDRANENKPLE